MLGAARKASTHSMAQGALLLCLAASWIALHKIPANAVTALGAVTVPKQLFGLEHVIVKMVYLEER